MSDRAVLYLACFLPVAGCSSMDSSIAVTRTDSAGVEIVVSHGEDSH